MRVLQSLHVMSWTHRSEGVGHLAALASGLIHRCPAKAQQKEATPRRMHRCHAWQWQRLMRRLCLVGAGAACWVAEAAAAAASSRLRAVRQVPIAQLAALQQASPHQSAAEAAAGLQLQA